MANLPALKASRTFLKLCTFYKIFNYGYLVVCYMAFRVVPPLFNNAICTGSHLDILLTAVLFGSNVILLLRCKYETWKKIFNKYNSIPVYTYFH